MKEKIWKSIPGLLTIAGGNLLYAFVVALFILPGQIISCGTTGLALVAQRLWGIPVSGFVLVFNVVMLVLGGLILGRKFAMTTILSSFLYPVFLSFAQYVVGDFVVTENLLLITVSTQAVHINSFLETRMEIGPVRKAIKTPTRG